MRNPQLIVAFAIGFIILFAFIGVFTYVNFILAAPPISLGPAALGLVYLVFIPALLTTPIAGVAAVKYGLRRAFWASIAVSLGGVALLSIVALAPMLVGLALIGVGLFFAQAAVTAFVGQAATADRAAASGLYLAAYYFGGVVGSLALGVAFSTGGWSLTLIVIALSLVVAAALGAALTLTDNPTTSKQIS